MVDITSIGTNQLPNLDQLENELESELESVRAIKVMLDGISEHIIRFPHLRDYLIAQVQALGTKQSVPEQSLQGSFRDWTEAFHHTSNPSTWKKAIDCLTNAGNVHRHGAWKEKNVDKVIQYFHDRNNAPATTKMIEEATGVGASSIRNVLYMRSKDLFIVAGTHGGQRVWMLAHDVANRPVSTPQNTTAGTSPAECPT